METINEREAKEDRDRERDDQERKKKRNTFDHVFRSKNISCKEEPGVGSLDYTVHDVMGSNLTKGLGDSNQRTRSKIFVV